MKNKLFFTALILTSAIAFTGCKKTNDVNNNASGEVVTEEITTEEAVTEEITTGEVATEEIITGEITTEEVITEEAATEEDIIEEPETEKTEVLIEYTNNEDNIPKEMTDIVKNSTEYDIGAYLYADIDYDTEKELLAAYLDESVGQWKIIRLESEDAEPEEFYSIPLAVYYDRCDLGLIDLKDKVHYVVNLYMSMGTSTEGHILEENEEGLHEVLNLFKTIWQADNGDVIIQNTSYGSIDKTTGVMMGRTWTYSYLTYDAENGQYKEYVANEITEEEFLAYEGAAECLQGIKNSYGDFDVKITIFKRNNGLMYIQCEDEDDTMISYGYYTVYYEDNKITMLAEKQDGIIEKNFTLLEEV